MVKMTARDRLLQECFKNQYEGELSTDDKEMFAFLAAICIVKISSSRYALINLDTVKNDLEGRINKRSVAFIKQLIENIENGFKEYVCEVKGFKYAYKYKQYVEWFKEMARNFSGKDENFRKMCEKSEEEIWKTIHKIIMLELESTIKDIKLKT